MAVNVEIFYSFQSPYSYLALEGIYDIEAKFDVELLWQPFSAKASGQHMPPAPIIPDKFSYLLEDTKRFAAEHNIPFKIAEGWPENEFDPARAIRGAVVASDLGVLKEYNYKVFHKWWGLGEDPNEESFLNELCDELDIELGDFLSKLSSSDTRERVKGVFKRGRKLNVFDTPTFLLGNEISGHERIFGIDKLPYLAERLTKMGLAKKR